MINKPNFDFRNKVTE